MSDQPAVLTFEHQDGAVIRTHEGSALAELVKEEDGWTRVDKPGPEEPKKAPAKKAPPKKATPKPKGEPAT